VTTLTTVSINLPATSIVGQSGSFNLKITPVREVFYPASIVIVFPLRHPTAGTSESLYVN